jgi:FkbM family methyltransferase
MTIAVNVARAKPENTLWQIGELFKLRSFTKLPDGTKLFFRPFTFDQGIIIEIYGCFEYDKVFSPQEGDVVIDVGAHIGAFAVKAAQKIGKHGKVIAVEPNAENYSMLKTNRELNKLANIIPVNAALSDHDGEAFLYSWIGHSGGFSIIEHHSQDRVKVPLFTIDKLTSKLAYDKIDFLKIDAEGAELEILRGAAIILKRSNAKIVLAGYHATDDPKLIVAFLESLSYNTRISENRFIYAWR